ncbi:unnamed protein product [Rotaria sp. Silwood2]|nr:unnamed protein product [Rotaria sp. Silwood2]
MVLSKHVEQLYDMIPLKSNTYNLYGPAECTIAALFYKVEIYPTLSLGLIVDSSVPLGKTLLNRRAYILDEYLQNTIINQIGELYIGGFGVFQGYLNRPDLTEKVLVELPSYITNDRRKYYKTGDLVKLNAEGKIVFVGRKDFQIKLRGQRIETGRDFFLCLSEIESVILKFSLSSTTIQNCLVTKVRDNMREQDYLVAYVHYSQSGKQHEKDQKEEIEKQIKDHCQERLPQYMVPSFFILLTQFPLNHNGKIERKLLPLPDFSTLITVVGEDHIEPKTELEHRIHNIWCNVLKQEKLFMDANLFALGGNSLLMIQLLNRYRTAFGSSIGDLNISQLFKRPTLQEHVNMLSLSTTITTISDLSKSDLKRAIPIQVQPSSESDLHQPFPVTELQQAYLIGRSNYFELGMVSVYSYREYDCIAQLFDIKRFEEALNKVIHRHEALRIQFLDDTQQAIIKNVPYYEIKVLDLSTEITDKSSIQEALIDRRKRLSHKILSISEWPLFDIQLTRWSRHGLRLHVGIDGIILDALSMTIFWHELLQLYNHPELKLHTLELSIRDYILSLKVIKELPIYQEDESYWIERLPTFPLGGPDLPLANSPNEIKVQKFQRITSNLETQLWQLVQKSLQQLKITPVSLLASLYALILNKWSNQQHFVINLPLFNRLPLHPQVNDILGEFTSILPLEVDFQSSSTSATGESFGEIVQHIQDRLWYDLDHSMYNGLNFFRELSKRRAQGHTIIYPVVFTSVLGMKKALFKTSRTIADEEYLGRHLGTEPVYAITQTPQVCIDYKSYENDNGELVVEWDYVSDLFPQNMVESMHGTYCHWLKELADRFDEIWQKPLSFRLPEKQLQRRNKYEQETTYQLLSEDVQNQLLHTMILEKAKTRSPEALAVLSTRGNLTYEQLISRSIVLRHTIMETIKHNTEAQKPSLCAILMEKGWEQVVACLGSLMAGQAFLPLDIESPAERLIGLIKEAECQIILTQQDHFDLAKKLCSSAKIIAVDNNEEIENVTYAFQLADQRQQSTNLAYVIYTSGSTGKPKGVAISHEAVLNTLLDINNRFNITYNDRIFALSHLNFDLAIYDIFGMLIAGGTIVIPSQKDYKNPEKWHMMIVEHQITIWNSVPMLMQMYVEYLEGLSTSTSNGSIDSVHTLQHVLLSGDRIPLSLPAEIYKIFGQTLELTSLGGATEASIWSIAHSISRTINVENKSTIPYGKPLRNQQYYVLDSQLDPCPDYVCGELYIGGKGLALGYYKDEEKTKQSFFQHPRTGERLYRTGDLGRFIPTDDDNGSGYIEFLGRQDFQVKLHGHRIELGEIEYHLNQHPSIQQAIADLVSSGSNVQKQNAMQLVAYIVPKRPYKIAIGFENDDAASVTIKDQIEKANFKLKRHGLLQNQKHTIKFDQHTVQLMKTELTNDIIDSYFERKSYRQFLNGEEDHKITQSEIQLLLKSVYSTIAISDSTIVSNTFVPKQLNLENLSKFLSYLVPIYVSSDQPLPKYRYASAGSLYPVQVYINIPKFSSDQIQSGLYYHHPDEHKLLKIEAENAYIDEGVKSTQNLFQIYLVGRFSAIAPRNGPVLAKEFCLLETGYIYGMLKKFGFNELGWRMKLLTTAIESSEQEYIIRNSLQVIEMDTFCSFSVELTLPTIQSTIPLRVADIDTTTSSNNSNSRTNIWLYFKATKDWFVYNKQTETLESYSPQFIYNQLESMELGHNGTILNDCSVAIFFTGSTTTTVEREMLIEAGKLSQLLMDEGIKTTYDIGICPIGTGYFIEHVNKSFSLLTPPLSLQQQQEPQQVLHTLLLGRVSMKQKYDRNPSEINRLKERQLLHKYLSAFLPDYMIPKHFLLIEIAPLNPNGKVDRKQLAEIFKSQYTENKGSAHDEQEQFMEPRTLLERKVYQIWQGVLRPASFAQERIWYDTKIRFNEEDYQTAIYNELLVIQVETGNVSINRLKCAINEVIRKHTVLRTAIMYDPNEERLKQYIKPMPSLPTTSTDLFSFDVTHTSSDEKEINHILAEEQTNISSLSVLDGILLRCHLIRVHENSSAFKNEPNVESISDILRINDIILFIFHHVAFDASSAEIFLNDLYLAYELDGQYLSPLALQYIDFSQYERDLDMSVSKDYWRRQMLNIKNINPIELPYDHKHELQRTRTGKGSSVQINLQSTLINQMLRYAEERKVTLFQLILAIYYAYLSKLIGANHICVGGVTANRYKPELQSLIGMFVNTIPYCLKFEPSSMSFDNLLSEVQQLCFDTIPHTHFPYQEISRLYSQQQTEDKQSNTLNELIQSFLQVEHAGIPKHQNGAWWTSKSIQTEALKGKEIATAVTKFNLNLRAEYNATKHLSMNFLYSTDLFEHSTIQIMSERFHLLIQQLFSTTFNREKQPICELSILLPNEIKMLKELNDTHVNLSGRNLKPINEQFFDRTNEYLQKLAVILDEQSLTYGEILYFVQQLSSYLIVECDVKVGDIICQCVERSIEMVLGILSILVCGAIYCPLNPQDPINRVSLLMNEVEAKLLLLHQKTSDLFVNSDQQCITLLNIETIISEQHMQHFESYAHIIPQVNVTMSNIAYIIFTSGSTGVPKPLAAHFHALFCMLAEDD